MKFFSYDCQKSQISRRDLCSLKMERVADCEFVNSFLRQKVHITIQDSPILCILAVSVNGHAYQVFTFEMLFISLI